MMKFLFYLGHVLLIAFFISLFAVNQGLNYILLFAAFITYIITIIRKGSIYRAEDERILEEYGKVVFNDIDKNAGEIETPYIFVLKNLSTQPKNIPLYVNMQLDYMSKKENLYSISSGISGIAAQTLLNQMKNKCRNMCMIEIFCKPSQMGMSVMYTNVTYVGPETKVLDKIEYQSMRSIIFCDINLKEGNSLGFMMLPSTEMVVKIYPYRKNPNEA